MIESVNEHLREFVRLENRIEAIVEARYAEHARSLIQWFKNVTDGIKMSGDDSVFADAWEEYKDQIQGQEGIFFEAYQLQFRDLARSYVNDLPRHELELLWMGTAPFLESEGEARDGYVIDDIVDQLCSAVRAIAREGPPFESPFGADPEEAELREEDGVHITRRQARAIAQAYLMGATGGKATVGDICAREELSRPPILYQPAFNLDGSWIAYVRRPWTGLRRSSEIVVVSRSSGEIVYAGGANDEG